MAKANNPDKIDWQKKQASIALSEMEARSKQAILDMQKKELETKLHIARLKMNWRRSTKATRKITIIIYREKREFQSNVCLYFPTYCICNNYLVKPKISKENYY
jgi:predicted DNA-binding protein (UPF0251 family)